MTMAFVSNAFKVVATGNYLFALGAYGIVRRSLTGLDSTWESIDIPLENGDTNSSYALASNGTRLVLGTSSYTVVSDDDGETWSQGCYNLAPGVVDIAWDDTRNLFVAISSVSAHTSPDGLVWTGVRGGVLIPESPSSSYENNALIGPDGYAYVYYPVRDCASFDTFNKVSRTNGTTMENLGITERRARWYVAGAFWATSDSATALFRSTDGVTWDTVISEVVNGPSVRRVREATDGTVYAIATVGYPRLTRIAVSTDGGVSFGAWISGSIPAASSHFVTDFIYDVANNVYVGIPRNGFGGGPSVNFAIGSTDLVTWTPLAPISGYNIRLHQRTNGEICIYDTAFTNVAISSDGFATATTHAVTNLSTSLQYGGAVGNTPGGDMFFSWRNSDGNTGVIVATSSNGYDFTRGEELPRPSTEAVSSENPPVFSDDGVMYWVWSIGSNGSPPKALGLYRSDDDGATWTTNVAPYPVKVEGSGTGPLNAPITLQVNQQNGNWIASCYDSEPEGGGYTRTSVQISTNGGATWTAVEEFNDDGSWGSDTPGYIIAAAGPNEGGHVMVTPIGEIKHSTDGEVWDTVAALPSPPQSFNPRTSYISWVHGDEYVIFTSQNEVFTSPNLVTWSQVVVYSTDNGTTWFKGSTSLNPNDMVGDVYFFGDGESTPNAFAPGKIVSVSADTVQGSVSIMLISTGGGA